MNKMYSLDEIGLLPSVISNVKSRLDVNPYENMKLPVFVSPMTCLLNSKNYKLFKESSFIPIYPVWHNDLIDCSNRARSLDYLKNNGFLDSNKSDVLLLIDCANGNMSNLFETVDNLNKNRCYYSIMAGNIANPKTYLEYAKHKIDYVRVGIGGGGGCTTSVQTGIHASLPWLITEIFKLKKFLKDTGQFAPKIVADGGINTIDKAIKCLALGADYVMMGSAFAKCEEACGDKIMKDGVVYREYYGQASEKGQIDRFGTIKSQPEGTLIYVPVNTNLKEFGKVFDASLRSAMSYCGATNLEEFIGKVDYQIMSQKEFELYDK